VSAEELIRSEQGLRRGSATLCHASLSSPSGICRCFAPYVAARSSARPEHDFGRAASTGVTARFTGAWATHTTRNLPEAAHVSIAVLERPVPAGLACRR
jgi:hypothetical protein